MKSWMLSSRLGELPSVSRHRHAVGVREHGRGVAVFDEVVDAFFAARIARDATRLPQLRKTTAATRDDLVHVGLVAGVPQDCITWRLEHPVQGQCEFNGPEIRAQVPAGFGDCGDDEVANFGGKFVEL